MNFLWLLAMVAGMAISIQAGMNSQFGMLLKNPLIATAIAFGCSCIFTAIAVVASTKHYPPIDILNKIPVHLWFSGGAVSAFAVAMFYYLILKMGVGSMMSYALTGQIIVAMTASHFGWFDLPVKQIDAIKISGVIALISGITLINWK